MNSRELFRRATSNWPVKILSLVAAIILYLSYRIGSLEERFFSIPLSVVTNEGFLAVGELPNSVRVSLKGQPDEIFLILAEDIEAYVDLTDHIREGQYRTPVLIRKSGTAEGSEHELRVEPLDVTITLEERISELVEIHPTIRGFPAEGFELSEYSISPESIEVIGPRSVVSILPPAKTQDIDLTGRAADFTVRIQIALDQPRAFIVGSDIVEFSGTIRPVVVARFIGNVVIEPVGVGPGLEVIIPTGIGELRVRGSVFDMDGLTADSVRLEIDFSSVTVAGEYELPVISRLPNGIEGLSIQPATELVRVSEKVAVDLDTGSVDEDSENSE